MRTNITITLVDLLLISLLLFFGSTPLSGIAHNKTQPTKDITPVVMHNETDQEARSNTHPKILGGLEALQNALIYPEEAKQQKIEGKVILQIHISERGEVIDTKIVEGISEGGLNESAISAVKKIKFEPAYRQQQPVPAWITIPILFKLGNEEDTGSLIPIYIQDEQTITVKGIPMSFEDAALTVKTLTSYDDSVIISLRASRDLDLKTNNRFHNQLNQ